MLVLGSFEVLVAPEIRFQHNDAMACPSRLVSRSSAIQVHDSRRMKR